MRFILLVVGTCLRSIKIFSFVVLSAGEVVNLLFLPENIFKTEDILIFSFTKRESSLQFVKSIITLALLQFTIEKIREIRVFLRNNRTFFYL